ncbi:MAG: RNA pseudouridine synthase, partial [Clostridia bacterium]|nr:RNA pseudouridine synthase [Clostridia bacterium]
MIIKTALESDAGKRLDVFAAEDGELSRSGAAKLIETGKITVFGAPVSKKYILQAGDSVEISLPDPEPYEAVAENIPIDVIYEDEHLAVINKPSGMVVHPAPGNYSGTLVNALL